VALLEIEGLSRHFGGLQAVSGLDMVVEEGEICALIGPNGAGKSTALNMIGGTLMPSGGTIRFKGEEVTRLPANARARRGIARVFQRNALFFSMSVLENVLAGSYLYDQHSFWEVFRRSSAVRARQEELEQRAHDLLAFVGLDHMAALPAASLPHGRQRALCVAVALACDPSLLLLDEPLTGMNAEEMTAITGIVRSLRADKGVTILVVEHNVDEVLGMCEHAVVLDYGKKLMEGTPQECVADPDVIEAYLGADIDVA
jgi:branched-chain amino acid transport system ATP-binding protein